MIKTKTLLRIAGVAALIVILVLLVTFQILDPERSALNEQIRSGLPGQFVQLSKGVVHYELAGPSDAQTVVLLNGFSAPYYIWDPTFEGLVEAGFRVLRYDFYGRGYSDRPDVDYDLELYTEQLEELLFALEVESPVSLAGLSIGGPIVADYANQHPDKVKALILVDPQVSPISDSEIFPMNLPGVGEFIMALYVVPVMLPGSQPLDFYNPEEFPDWEERYREQMQYTGFRSALLSTMREMVEVDPLDEYRLLRETRIPVVVFWGREDQTISEADINRLREALPGVVYYPIDQAGHLPHYERSDVVNPLMIEFLKGLESQSSSN